MKTFPSPDGAEAEPVGVTGVEDGEDTLLGAVRPDELELTEAMLVGAVVVCAAALFVEAARASRPSATQLVHPLSIIIVEVQDGRKKAQRYT